MEKADPTLRNLYPGYSDEELEVAEDNLNRYLELVLQIHDRLEAEQELAAKDKSSLTRFPDSR
ncbi:MAG: hypothetical protein AB1813_19270 [Verrucomicrobiota bacterium]